MDNKNIIINKIIILLYFVVAFIPIMGAVDIVNTQWFYIAITNVISLSYIFFNRQKYNLNTTTKLTASIFIGSFIFFLVSILSITKSLVISESIISLMYFVLTMVALWVFYFTIKQNPKKYFDFFAIIIAIFGFIESFQVFNYFNTHTHQIRSNELLEALKHNYGNRNILAISIIMKLPFLIYLYFKKKKIIKITALIGLLMFCIAVLLIGARTAIYGGFIILIALIIYKLFLINSLKNKIKHVIPLLIIPLLSLLISLNLNKIQKNKLNSFVDLTFTQSKKSLISINNSLTTINLLNDSGRGKIWQTAIEDIKRSPFLGIGIGNWKLMPKKGFTEKRKSKSYSYIKRVHNDFLQVFAEVGVFGFIIYLSFYMFVFTLLLKRIITNIKNQNREEAFYSIILFASFSIYFLDAFFNFPHERTPIQIFMFFILAIILAFSPKKEIVNIKTIPIFIFIFLLSLGGLIVGFKSYKASRVYKILYSDFEGKDIFKGKSKIPYNKVLKILPEFPEIDNRVRSIHLLKSFYAYNDNKKDKSLFFLIKLFNSSFFLIINIEFSVDF